MLTEKSDSLQKIASFTKIEGQNRIKSAPSDSLQKILSFTKIEGQNRVMSVPSCELCRKMIEEAHAVGQNIRMSISRSPNFSETRTSTFQPTSCPTSSSCFFEDIFSFDGTNQRTNDRYKIGIGMLKAQIHHGADPNGLVTHGERTTLMFAVLARDFSFVKELVELGVDVNLRNCKGETALSLANEVHRDDIANYLRAQGAGELLRIDRV